MAPIHEEGSDGPLALERRPSVLEKGLWFLRATPIGRRTFGVVVSIVAAATAEACRRAVLSLGGEPTGGEPTGGEPTSGVRPDPEADGKDRGMRLPVIYLPHGGGPWPFVDVGRFVLPGEDDALRAYLEGLPFNLPAAPRALLVISAHWEEPVPTVMTSEHPPMLYDYFGFPPASYEIQWPAPGDRLLAARVRALLDEAGIPNAEDPKRGFDHGTFVPLKVAFPRADLPTVQLSLKRGLDPAEHLALGRALAPLRDEGVLIVGSGMSYHNLRAFGRPQAAEVAETFDAWLCEAGQAGAQERDERLIGWAQAPGARQSHPREEHLLPLMVIAGAAGDDLGRVGFSGTFSGMRISALHYG